MPWHYSEVTRDQSCRRGDFPLLVSAPGKEVGVESIFFIKLMKKLRFLRDLCHNYARGPWEVGPVD